MLVLARERVLERPLAPPLVPREGQELEVWGVVASVVRKRP